jgi:hypothetical protein
MEVSMKLGQAMYEAEQAEEGSGEGRRRAEAVDAASKESRTTSSTPISRKSDDDDEFQKKSCTDAPGPTAGPALRATLGRRTFC